MCFEDGRLSIEGRLFLMVIKGTMNLDKVKDDVEGYHERDEDC
jgi:hypothetical protein